MKKLLIIFCVAAAGVVSLAELNYEQACEKAVKAGSDKEILQVMRSHGYMLEDTFQHVGPVDKIKALIICLNK